MLRRLFGAYFGRNEDLAAVIQIAVHFIGVVEQVRFTRCFAGCDLRYFRFVVRAARAFAALGVPPFWIWHDAFKLWLKAVVGLPETFFC
jgi:hypothetical protein